MNNTVPFSNTSSGPSSSEYPAPFSKTIIAAILTVSIVEMLVGLPANLRICFVLYKRKDLRKVPHILLGNLSLIGVLVSCIDIPLYLLTYVVEQLLNNPLHEGFCVARITFSILFFGLQTLNLVAMAIDRLDSVVRPFKRRITVNNVRKVVRGIWSVAGLATAVPLVLILKYHYPNNCHVNTLGKKYSRTYTLIFVNISLFGTVIIIFASFLRIVKKLRSSPFAESNQRSELQVTKLSYTVLFFFIISWLPILAFSILKVLAGFAIPPNVRGVTVLLRSIANINFVVNPFVHINMIRAAQTAPSKPSHKERQKERTGNVWIEEQPQMQAVDSRVDTTNGTAMQA